MKFLDRRRLVPGLLAASLLLNLATIGYLAQTGGLHRLLLRLDLVDLGGSKAPFQEAAEAHFRKLPNVPDEVVFAGDSLVAAGPWSDFYSRVHTRGIGGEPSAGLLGRLGEITEGKPRKVFLLTGTNDLASAVPVDQFLRNYRAILEKIRRDSPGTRTYVISVLPVNLRFAARPTYTNAEVREANRRLKELVAGFPGVTFVDVTDLLVDGAGDLKDEYAADPLHLRTEGYLAIRERLLSPVIDGDDKVTQELARP